MESEFFFQFQFGLGLTQKPKKTITEKKDYINNNLIPKQDSL